jgi:hypothetical protein
VPQRVAALKETVSYEPPKRFITSSALHHRSCGLSGPEASIPLGTPSQSSSNTTRRPSSDYPTSPSPSTTRHRRDTDAGRGVRYCPRWQVRRGCRSPATWRRSLSIPIWAVPARGSLADGCRPQADARCRQVRSGSSPMSASDPRTPAAGAQPMSCSAVSRHRGIPADIDTVASRAVGISHRAARVCSYPASC